MKTFTITKEQIKFLSNISALYGYELKIMFPKAFETEPIELTLEQIAEKFNVSVDQIKIKK